MTSRRARSLGLAAGAVGLALVSAGCGEVTQASPQGQSSAAASPSGGVPGCTPRTNKKKGVKLKQQTPIR